MHVTARAVRAAFITASLLVASCAPASGPPISVDEWCGELLRAERARAAGWECTGAEILTDAEIDARCGTSLSGASLRDAIDRGDVVWDAQRARAYVDSVASGEGRPIGELPELPVLGSVPVGELCTSFTDTAGIPSDCAPRSRCIPPGEGEAAICVGFGLEGDPCGDAAHLCEIGFACEAEAGGARCRRRADPPPLLGHGAACTTSIECASRLCAAGACRGPFALGASCAADPGWGIVACEGCPNGCSPEGSVCVDLCDDEGYCDDGGSCVPARARAQACERVDQCGLDSCIDAVCQFPLCILLP